MNETCESNTKAESLRKALEECEAKLEKLESFDEKEIIEGYCERIVLEVSTAIQSAIEHLGEIERRMMSKIREYRERCLKELNRRSSEPVSSTKQEITRLTKEMRKFNGEWKNHLRTTKALDKESEINDALLQTAQYASAIERTQERKTREVLNWEMLVFNEKSQFFNEWNHVGEIGIIPVPSNRRRQNLIFFEREMCLILLKIRLEPSIASHPKEKKITIQDTPVSTLTNHSEWVNQVLFLPDGRLVSCSSDNTIQIWDLENGKTLFKLKSTTVTCYGGTVHSIALLPSGHLASGSGNTINIWNLLERKAITTVRSHSDSVISLQVLKNGKLVSYSKDDTIKIWNLNSKEELEELSCISGHENTRSKLRLYGVLSDDYFVTCSRVFSNGDFQKCILRVWNSNEPNPVKSIFTGYDDVRSLLVLSNGQVALGFLSGTISRIDLACDSWTRTKKTAHVGWVSTLAQLSNGNLISAGKDGSNMTIKVWNLIDWTLLQIINTGHLKWINSLSVSADEKFLASGSDDNTIELWPINSESTLQPEK